MPSTSDIAVSVRGLSKSYTIARQGEKHVTLAESLLAKARRPFARAPKETFWALKDVDFDIKKGDVVGIIGRNGAGKSTLLKILSRITEPTAGQIDLYGRVGSLLEVGTGFHPELTGRENVFLNGAILGMTKAEIRKQFDAIVEFAGIEQFLDTPVKRYSSGMYVRLAFAVAAHLESEILIVDEVLAVGDADFQRKCIGKMKDVADGGRTVFFVSHNLSAIAALCNRAILLERGTVVRAGNAEHVVSLYSRMATTNEYRPESGPLRRIDICQDGQKLIVTADFECPHAMQLPNLGFVIHDSAGTPLCGANPLVAGMSRLDQALSKGRIRAEQISPILLDGQYRVSVWFGDGYTSIVEFPNCLTFDVAGMAGPRQYPVSIVGSVQPLCTFSFEPTM